tara:strand:+ start:156 stop:557 length:402 start_codon:yes stop_codon:yes gene_type:complete
MLEEWPVVEEIDVYGMNWNGDKTMHIDFLNKSLVAQCCTKCVIHSTVTKSYGNNNRLIMYILLLICLIITSIGIIGIMTFFVCYMWVKTVDNVVTKRKNTIEYVTHKKIQKAFGLIFGKRSNYIQQADIVEMT